MSWYCNLFIQFSTINYPKPIVIYYSFRIFCLNWYPTFRFQLYITNRNIWGMYTEFTHLNFPTKVEESLNNFKTVLQYLGKLLSYSPQPYTSSNDFTNIYPVLPKSASRPQPISPNLTQPLPTSPNLTKLTLGTMIQNDSP